MPKGDFLWCDLSTFQAEGTKRFYAALLGWSYETTSQPDGSPYHLAATGTGDAAAIFEMPEKFQKIGLPSFWMSYIAVDDIDATVEQARRLGGKVEVGPLAYGGGASIALIRDPLGAGFTVYQGSDLAPRRSDAPPGHMAWNALYVSDAAAVTPFYETLFDWRIAPRPSQAGVLAVQNARGEDISSIHELPESIRGRFEFWGVHFAVPDLAAAKAKVSESGGTILYEDTTANEPTLLAQDRDGAAFFLAPSKGAQSRRSGSGIAERPASRAAPFKWKTVLALAIIWVAVVLELNWVWGVLFIMWTVPALRTGQTFLVEPIMRSENRVLFWLIVGTWIVLSVFLILFDLLAWGGAVA